MYEVLCSSLAFRFSHHSALQAMLVFHSGRQGEERSLLQHNLRAFLRPQLSGTSWYQRRGGTLEYGRCHVGLYHKGIGPCDLSC